MTSNKIIFPIKNSILLLLFILPSIYFYLITNYFLPYLNNNSGLKYSINWFICGFLVFTPLFILALFLSYKDGFNTQYLIKERLRLKKLTSKDWKYVIVSILAIFSLTTIILGVSTYLNYLYGIPIIKTIPPFMKVTIFSGWERLYLLIWGLMFFFNIFGEELLWRGYILTRQEKSGSNLSWLINSFLWLIFHFCFGLDLLIILVPIIFILPFAVYKTQNTTVGIFIHAFVNGPSFILVSLGVIV